MSEQHYPYLRMFITNIRLSNLSECKGSFSIHSSGRNQENQANFKLHICSYTQYTVHEVIKTDKPYLHKGNDQGIYKLQCWKNILS